MSKRTHHLSKAERAKLRERAEKLFARMRLNAEHESKLGRAVNVNERASAHKLLVKLLTKLEIEEHELGRRPGVDAETIDKHEYRVGIGNATTSAVILVGYLCKLFGGACFYSMRRLHTKNTWGYTREAAITVYARPSDFAKIENWANHLIHELMIDIAREKPRSRLTYGNGWAREVNDRLRKLYGKERPREVTKSVALARIDAEAVMNSKHRLRTSRSSRSSNPSDYSRGRAAGSKARLPGSSRSIRGGRLALGPGR